MDNFDAYWKALGRIDPRDSVQKEQMRLAFRAGVNAGRMADKLDITHERNACAALVRAAGCGCGGGHGPDRGDDDVFVSESAGWHADWCPIALAAAIEARGRG